MSKHIAIVEDEIAICENYASTLRKHGYEVSTHASRPAAQQAFSAQLPDLAILDIGLGAEVEGGFELCRYLRTLSDSLPIIFLSARDSDLDTISGLRLGADDYLTKDISLPNLCARVAALFRRIDALQRHDTQEHIIERSSLSLDMNRYEARWQGAPVGLSLTEFWVVHTLALHPGHVKNREQLMNQAHILVDDTTITSHIKRIRKKFVHTDPAFTAIETVYGIGYRWLER